MMGFGGGSSGVIRSWGWEACDGINVLIILSMGSHRVGHD